MCDMPADRSKDTLVLRLWPASEDNGNWTSVNGTEEFAEVGALSKAYSETVVPYPGFLSHNLTSGKVTRLI
jgi:hypothetical protein